jgi:hypothetical protein
MKSTEAYKVDMISPAKLGWALSRLPVTILWKLRGARDCRLKTHRRLQASDVILLLAALGQQLQL